MLIKTIKLSWLMLVICLGSSVSFAITPAKADTPQETMLWEMRPNESLIELAAMFYPKSAAMQRAFVAKTQQLNTDTQSYADANTRYPTATTISVPTLKSLSVKGTGTKKHKRLTKVNATENIAQTEQPTIKVAESSASLKQEEKQLTEKKDALDEALTKKNADVKSLEEKMADLQKQLDQSKTAPVKNNTNTDKSIPQP